MHPTTHEQSGQGIRIGIIDSGVHATHPHVCGVSGGVGFDSDGHQHDDYTDRLGHGTAVAAAIRERAPASDLFAIKVFDSFLSATIDALVNAIDWAATHQMKVINLSLGTTKPEHKSPLSAAVDRACECGVIIVSAFDRGEADWLPGSLPSVIPVQLDWQCPRNEFRTTTTTDGRIIFLASGFPRSIPGVPPSKNLKGLSFAVANMTGFVVKTLGTLPNASVKEIAHLLLGQAASTRVP